MKRYIAEGLNRYISMDKRPWHMPGHKRKNIICENIIDKILNEVQSIDVTEVPGTDDLYEPEEMILDSMKELAEIYNTYASYYLVNGSTCGIFTAISAAFYDIEKNSQEPNILIAGNCHKSVYNAVELLGLKSCCVEPRWNSDKDLTIQGAVFPEDIEEICKANAKLRAMVITSPNYEGVVSDIDAISRVAKKYNVMLIVDEAHGPHLPFATKAGKYKNKNFPVSSVYKGADIVVQSIHKTLTGLTQTAIMHVNNKGLNEAVKRYLSVYMSSSPSYILLCSMERAIWNADNADFESYNNRLSAFRNKAKELKNISLVTGKEVVDAGAFDYDSSRIVIKSNRATGDYMQEVLDRVGNIAVEMRGINYVVLISTYMDDEEDFHNLFQALKLLDMELEGKEIQFDKKHQMENKLWYSLVGTVAADNVYAYPPGSYIIRKNQLITKDAIDRLVELQQSGIRLRGKLI